MPDLLHVLVGWGIFGLIYLMTFMDYILQTWTESRDSKQLTITIRKDSQCVDVSRKAFLQS
jgi:hypothetical protein